MATLTETAYYSRKSIKYGLLGLFGLVVLRGALIMGIRVYKQAFPPPPPAPTVRYGKLPRLIFPAKGTNIPSTITYNLETPDGSTNLENFRNTRAKALTQAKVFFMPQPNPSLLALERAKTKAAAFGFKDDPQLLDNSTYRFAYPSVAITLDIHPATGIFHLYFSWQGNQELLGKPPASVETGIEALKAFLQTGNAMTDEILNGHAKTTFLKVVGNTMIKVNSLSEADFMRVDLSRKDLDDLPVYTSNPNEGVVWGIVYGGGGGRGQVIELTNRYFLVEREEYSTYPIKTSLQAWQELGEGKGAIVNLGNNLEGNVSIRRVYLGYYDSTLEPQKFMQPIYIFEGDNDFVAYVPAITDAYFAN